eukprot:4887799-Amphidinium_carterae.1
MGKKGGYNMTCRNGAGRAVSGDTVFAGNGKQALGADNEVFVVIKFVGGAWVGCSQVKIGRKDADLARQLLQDQLEGSDARRHVDMYEAHATQPSTSTITLNAP